MIFMFRGNGEFGFDIVGESHYQKALEEITGPKTKEGHALRCTAVFVLEDRNPYDPQAVAICLTPRIPISATHVGYLSRSDARKFRKNIATMANRTPDLMLCRALICGGWDSHAEDDYGDIFPPEESDFSERSVGHFGVKLDLCFPLEIDPDWTNLPIREAISHRYQ